MYMYAVLSKKQLCHTFQKMGSKSIFVIFSKQTKDLQEIFYEKKIFGYTDISKTDKNAILKLFFLSTVQKSQSDKFCHLLN